MKKYLSVVLKKMCNIVGTNYKDIDFKEHGWFLKYSWTTEQANEFSMWLEDYLYKNPKARKELLERPIKNKEVIKQAVSWFMLDYSWRLKEKK